MCHSYYACSVIHECMFNALTHIIHVCTGDQWHLRRTNWCREAVEVLEDEVSIIFVSLYSITTVEPL